MPAARIPAKSRTLVSADGLEYTRWSSGDDMLFDLGEDPLEQHELSTSSPALRARALEQLTDGLIQLADDARGTPVPHG